MPPVGSWFGHDHEGTAPNLGSPVGIYRLDSTDSVTWRKGHEALVSVVGIADRIRGRGCRFSGNRVQRWPGSSERDPCLGESSCRADDERTRYGVRLERVALARRPVGWQSRGRDDLHHQ
jgi:hypothetical protein